MKNNRQAIIRYKSIDRLLADGKEHSIEELLEAVNQALKSHGFEPITRMGSICDAIRDMEGLWEYSPNDDNQPLGRIRKGKDGRKTTYSYLSPLDAIWTEHIDPEILKIREVLERVRYCTGLQEVPWLQDYLQQIHLDRRTDSDIKPAIAYETNLNYKGLVHLKFLFECIVRQKVVVITYTTFRKEDPGERFLVHPQLLKQYNNRWFLFADRETIDNQGRKEYRICNYALDRIQSVSEIKGKDSKEMQYHKSTFDFNTFFNSRIGVSGYITNKKATIVLQFNESRIPYILTKPIHHSQMDLGDNKVSILVAVTPELLTTIKSFGADVEVLYPQWLRDELLNEYRQLAQRYSKPQSETQQND